MKIMKIIKIIIAIALIAIFTIGVITIINSKNERLEENNLYKAAVVTPTSKPTKAPTPEPTQKTTSTELHKVTATPAPNITVGATPTPLPTQAPTPIPTRVSIQTNEEPDPEPVEPALFPEPLISYEPMPPELTPIPTPIQTPTTEKRTIEPIPTPEPAKVIVNQFILDLMKSLGVTSDDPIKSAIEKGIIAPLQFNENQLTDLIKNKDAIKIAVAALGDIEYPDYLTAYEGLIQDKNDLEPMYREDILKAIYAGVLSVKNGAAEPKNYCISSNAEKIIEKVANPEKRDIINFATPDLEFEKFMVSPEAEKYVTLENVFKVTDGKFIYDSNNIWGNYGCSLLPIFYNPDSNKVAYELLNGLVSSARKYGHYVATFYNDEADAVLFCYYKSHDFFMKHTDFSSSMFTIHIILSPKKYAYEAQSEYTNYIWEVHRLFDADIIWKGIMPEDINFQQDEFKEALNVAFKAVYGDSLGKKFYDYTINEYNQESNYALEDKEYMNTSISYFDELGGLEIVNNNKNGSSIIFATDMVKGEIK